VSDWWLTWHITGLHSQFIALLLQSNTLQSRANTHKKTKSKHTSKQMGYSYFGEHFLQVFFRTDPRCNSITEVDEVLHDAIRIGSDHAADAAKWRVFLIVVTNVTQRHAPAHKPNVSKNPVTIVSTHVTMTWRKCEARLQRNEVTKDHIDLRKRCGQQVSGRKMEVVAQDMTKTSGLWTAGSNEAFINQVRREYESWFLKVTKAYLQNAVCVMVLAQILNMTYRHWQYLWFKCCAVHHKMAQRPHLQNKIHNPLS